MKLKTILLVGATLAVLGCKKSQVDTNIQVLNDNFSKGASGWLVDFVDYPIGKEDEWEIGSSLLNLPAPLDSTRKGIMLSGINRSDDLFMFMKKKITGLKPNQLYTVNLEVEVASNAPSNMLGAGGAPGEDVRIKAGLTAVEPLKVVDDMEYYRLNLDKDSQSSSGKDLFYIDHIGNGTQEATYKLLTRSGKFQGRSDANGDAWFVIGTDSSHESTTTLYYTNIKVSLEN